MQTPQGDVPLPPSHGALGKCPVPSAAGIRGGWSFEPPGEGVLAWWRRCQSLFKKRGGREGGGVVCSWWWFGSRDPLSCSPDETFWRRFLPQGSSLQSDSHVVGIVVKSVLGYPGPPPNLSNIPPLHLPKFSICIYCWVLSLFVSQSRELPPPPPPKTCEGEVIGNIIQTND